MNAILDMQKARKELESTSMDAIERATAITWGGRAVASYQLSQETKGQDRFKHFYEGENYRQEALEHAAMAEDRGKLLQQIHDEIETPRNTALLGIRGRGAAA